MSSVFINAKVSGRGRGRRYRAYIIALNTCRKYFSVIQLQFGAIVVILLIISSAVDHCGLHLRTESDVVAQATSYELSVGRLDYFSTANKACSSYIYKYIIHIL